MHGTERAIGERLDRMHAALRSVRSEGAQHAAEAYSERGDLPPVEPADEKPAASEDAEPAPSP